MEDLMHESKPVLADVLIVTALKEEYDEARKVDDGALEQWTEWSHRNFEFATRTYKGKNGAPLRVALTWASRKGEQATTEAAGQLLDVVGARCLAMSGVCAGRRGKVAPGDAILAKLVYRYDAGKKKVEYNSGVETSVFQADPDPFPLRDSWLRRAKAFGTPDMAGAEWLANRPPTLEAQGNWILDKLAEKVDPNNHVDLSTCCPNWMAAIKRLRELKHIRVTRGKLELTKTGDTHIQNLRLLGRGAPPPPPPWQVHIAQIATGGNVMRDPQLFDKLSNAMCDVLGVEMEAAAIGATAHARGLGWVVVKAVMDHADHDKDDCLKAFAARASAECLVRFLRLELADDIREMTRDAQGGATDGL
jgi:nucleoside phosphorylase